MRIELEEKLYTRDPIIAHDGYIPNSVIRKKFKPHAPTPPASPKKKWTPKPVPKPNRKHMPDYWEPEDSDSEDGRCQERVSESDKEVLLLVDNWEDESSSSSSMASSLTSSPRSESHECHHGNNKVDSDAGSNSESEVSSESEESSEGDNSEIIKLNEEEDDETVVFNDAKTMADKPEGWEDGSEQNSMLYSRMKSYERDSSRSIRKMDVTNQQQFRASPETRGLYTIKPQMFPFQKINSNLESNRRRRRSDDEKKPTSAVTNLSADLYRDEEKIPTSAVTDQLADLYRKEKLEKEEEESELLRQLQQGLLPLLGDMNVDATLQQLMRYLDHPDIDIQQRAMESLCIIQEKQGIPDLYREQAVALIIEKIKTSPLSRVKIIALESLAFIGYERRDCITQLLIHMADHNEDVQIAACEGLSYITGLREKDTLLKKLDVMGITNVYNSKEDEEQAMRILGEKFGAERDDYFQMRISKWIESATPSPLLDDLEADEIEHLLHKDHGSWEQIQHLLHLGRGGREQHLSMYPDGGTSQTTDKLKELSFLTDGMDQKSRMWSPTSKKHRKQVTDTEYMRKMPGYETGPAGSAVKKNTMKMPGYETGPAGSAVKKRTMKMPGYETGPAGSAVKKRTIINPKVPGMYKYYDQRHLKEQSGSRGSEELENEPELSRGDGQEESGIGMPVPQEESDIQSVAASIHSQEQYVGDAVSTHDSGISRDLSSDFSNEKKVKLIAMPSRRPSRLSPVKSVTGLETSLPKCSPTEDSTQSSTSEEIEAQRKKEGDWRQFFQLPTAMERRRMNQVKKEKAAGKLRQTHLPPISYFTENLPMLPGEAGMRLLQTVRIGEKVPVDGDHRYRVEPLPGKLAVHTQNEDAGLSNFGIIQMQWTTGVPNFQPPVIIPPSPPVVPRNSHRYSQHQLSATKESFLRFRPSMEDMSSFLPHLMGHGQTTQSHSQNYEWEHPLPPPPDKESRTNLTNMKKDHDNYCKYYKLVKKQLHFYTSKNPEDLRLPEVVVKQADLVSPQKDKVLKQKLKSNLSKSKSNVMLPPIKLGQLVRVF